jgi:hypothetical protein
VFGVADSGKFTWDILQYNAVSQQRSYNSKLKELAVKFSHYNANLMTDETTCNSIKLMSVRARLYPPCPRLSFLVQYQIIMLAKKSVFPQMISKAMSEKLEI